MTLVKLIAAGDQDFGVAGESLGVAGDANDGEDGAFRQFARLLFGAGARRVEHDGVEACEFVRQQRAGEQVARLALRSVAGRCAARPAAQPGGERRGIAFDAVNLGLFGEPQRESANAAIKIGGFFRVADRIDDKLRQNLFARRRRLEESAGRRRHAGAADGDVRRAALDQRDAVIGDAGEIEAAAVAIRACCDSKSSLPQP